MTVTRQSIHRILKDSGRLFLSEHEGELWATDSYWLLPLSSVPAIESLLAWWNLGAEPGNYLIDQRVYPNAKIKEPPKVGDILRWKDKATEELRPRTLASVVLTFQSRDHTCVIFGSDDQPFGVRQDFLELVAGQALSPSMTVKSIPGEPMKPMWIGAGCVMPVRLV